MNRLISAVVVVVMLVTFIGQDIAVNGESSVGTKTTIELVDIANHWGESVIKKGVERGYVNGYTDGTFKPNQAVSRAEFIKMAIVALEKDAPDVAGAKWYQRYVNAAIKHNLISTNEYSNGNFNTDMSREEMAAVSARAIGLSAESLEEYMYLAVSKGLITGVGNGQLAAKKTTTRAESVTIIERIIRVLKGDQLPVDEQAVKNAEQAMNAPKDPWGRAIRTTNLPKNYKDFPYILEQWPNEMYEMKLNDQTGTAMDVINLPQYDQAAVKQWADLTETWGKHLLNVDYRTINDKWKQGYMNTMLIQGTALENSTNKYIQKVKDNKIIVEGTLKAEPSMVQMGKYGAYMIRVYYNLRIVSSNTNDFVIDDMYYFVPQFKHNVWYEGYSDIEIATGKLNASWSEYRVWPMASLFGSGIVREKK